MWLPISPSPVSWGKYLRRMPVCVPDGCFFAYDRCFSELSPWHQMKTQHCVPLWQIHPTSTPALRLLLHTVTPQLHGVRGLNSTALHPMHSLISDHNLFFLSLSYLSVFSLQAVMQLWYDWWLHDLYGKGKSWEVKQDMDWKDSVFIYQFLLIKKVIFQHYSSSSALVTHSFKIEFPSPWSLCKHTFCHLSVLFSQLLISIQLQNSAFI